MPSHILASEVWVFVVALVCWIGAALVIFKDD
jgi:hypothetical protein